MHMFQLPSFQVYLLRFILLRTKMFLYRLNSVLRENQRLKQINDKKRNTSLNFIFQKHLPIDVLIYY